MLRMLMVSPNAFQKPNDASKATLMPHYALPCGPRPQPAISNGPALMLQQSASVMSTVPSTILASACRLSSSRRLLLGRARHRQEALLRPQLDERQHGLDFLVADEAVQATDVDEVDEARVELLVRVDVPEGLQPVAVVDVRVAPHHLPVDALDVALERLREARRLAEPLAACELGERGVEGGGGEGLRGIVYGGSGTGGVGRGVDQGGGVCGEDGGVVDLADDPFLDEVDVLDGGDLDGLLVVVKPCVCVSAGVRWVVSGGEN